MKIFRQYLRMLFVFVLLLSFFSCDFHLYDPDKPKPGYLDEMPEETSIGANTFGCYVNGELAATQGYYQQNGVKPDLYFWGMPFVNGYWAKEDGKQTLFLKINTKIAVIDFRLKNDIHLGENDCYFLVEKKGSDITFNGFETIIDIIRFDTVEYIISGRFDDLKMPAIPNNLRKDTLYITQGQFDIKYGQNF